MPTNTGGPIRVRLQDAINSSNDPLVKERLAHAISDNVFQGNAAGLTKTMALSVMAQATGEDLPLNKKSLQRLEEWDAMVQKSGVESALLERQRQAQNKASIRDANAREAFDQVHAGNTSSTPTAASPTLTAPAKKRESTKGQPDKVEEANREYTALDDLIGDKVLHPGKAVLSVDHNQETHLADLLEDGNIIYKGNLARVCSNHLLSL